MLIQRYIYINDEKIPVTEEVYHAYKRPAWAERKRQQTRAKKERSLEMFSEGGYDIPSGDALVEEIVADKLLLDMLMSALDKLDGEERELIDALFYAEKSVREIAVKTGMSKSAVQRAKDRAIEKLKKYFE